MMSDLICVKSQLTIWVFVQPIDIVKTGLETEWICTTNEPTAPSWHVIVYFIRQKPLFHHEDLYYSNMHSHSLENEQGIKIGVWVRGGVDIEVELCENKVGNAFTQRAFAIAFPLPPFLSCRISSSSPDERKALRTETVLWFGDWKPPPQNSC